MVEKSPPFSEFADALPFLLWSADGDGVVDFANRAFLNYIGGPQTRPQDWTSFVHADDRDHCLSVWNAAVATGEPYLAEFRLRRGGDGSYRWHQVKAVPVRNGQGQVVKYYGTATDIDDHKRRESELERLSSRLVATLESITNAFYTVDLDWRITYLNSEFEKWLNRPRQDLLGRNIWETFPHLLGTSIDVEFHKALAEKTAVKFVQYFPLVDRWVEVHAYPWAEGLSVYLHDVTVQRAIDEKMRQSQRLEAIGQLTGGIAHDFNNLLMVVLGNAEILCESLGHDEDLHSLAELTLSSAEKGAQLTQRLLSFARQMPLEPSMIDVNLLLLGMDGLLRRTLGEHVEIDILQEAGLWNIMVDESQLENAILNLCINARDAMPDGGKLTIETLNTQLDTDAVQGDSELIPGDYVMIAVSDTGEGMPPETLARVFEPFFTTKPVGEGSGLGLSMVYGFIRQSNGQVRIYSHPGVGTTVKLYLPRQDRDIEIAEASHGSTDVPTGSEKILLVEDDEQVRKHVARQLDRLGYKVVSASNGAEALQALRDDGDFELLFTDVVMPGGMSGRALAEEARKLRPDLPILFTSGYTENAFVRNGRLEPGIHLLSKPYRRQELAQKVRSVLMKE